MFLFVSARFNPCCLHSFRSWCRPELVENDRRPDLHIQRCTSWTPSQIPTDADNVTFAIDVPGTPNIFIAALSNGLNVNVLDNDWIFTSAGGSNLDTEGTVTIDDALGTALSNGSNLTVNAAVNWDTVLDLIVGDAGYGTLNFEADADFRGRDVFIGNQLGSVGVVNVDGNSVEEIPQHFRPMAPR